MTEEDSLERLSNQMIDAIAETIATTTDSMLQEGNPGQMVNAATAVALENILAAGVAPLIRREDFLKIMGEAYDAHKIVPEMEKPANDSDDA